MKGKVWLAFSLLLVLSLALAGCGQKITAEEIVAKMQETVENTRDAHAVVTGSVDVQGIEMSATVEMWEKSPNRVRVEVLETSQADLAGTVLVSDGQQAWIYEPARNRVTVGTMADIETPLPQQMLTELQDVIQQMLDVSDVELVGEETVTGRGSLQADPEPQGGRRAIVLPRRWHGHALGGQGAVDRPQGDLRGGHLWPGQYGGPEL